MRIPIIKYLLVLSFIIGSSISQAQEDQNQIPEAGNSNSESESIETPLKLSNGMKSSLFYFDKMEFDEYMKFSNNWINPLYNNTYQTDETNGSINLLMQKKKLVNALQTKINFQRKDDLGLFGQILGYVNIAAAASLAVVHLNKYYWQDKEKKKDAKKKP